MMQNHVALAARVLVLSAGLAVQSGCTSALTTAYLRDTLWEFAEHAAEPAPEPAADADDTAREQDAGDAAAAVAADVAVDRADAERRQAAIEEAVQRLARIGTLDVAAQAMLVETLQATQQEDWPVVIEAFSATLAESRPTAPDEPAEGPPPEPHVVAKTPTADAVPAPIPQAVVPVPTVAATPAPPPAPASAAAPPPPPDQAASAPPTAAAALAVNNACFASRVQAWGIVDRLPAEGLRPGQEVIVYFELDGLVAAESPAGFETSVDTTLRLVAADGRELHAWSFEPLVETCPARRRDYFARYVVRLPDSAAGDCRLEVNVEDLQGQRTVTATLPCTVE
jgi:hypothetical protein